MQVVAVFIRLGPRGGDVARRAPYAQRVDVGVGRIGLRAAVQVRQPVRDVQLQPPQFVAQQAVVGLEIRVADDVQAHVQPPLEVARQFLHRVLPPEEEIHVVRVQRGVDGGGVLHLLLLQVDDGGVSALLGDDGAALHVGRRVVVSGGDGYLAVLCGVLVQPIDAENDFVVVAQAQGLGEVVLRLPALRVVEVHQPVGLVGEDGGQREDDHEGDGFRG